MDLLERRFNQKVLKEGPGAGYTVDCKDLVPNKPQVTFVGFNLKENALEFTYSDTKVYGTVEVSGYDWGTSQERILFDEVYAEGGLYSGRKSIVFFLPKEFWKAIAQNNSNLLYHTLEEYDQPTNQLNDFINLEYKEQVYENLLLETDMEDSDFKRTMHECRFDPTKFIQEFGDPFSGMKEMIGGGYTHKRMPDYFQLTDRGEAYTEEQSFYITDAQLTSKELAKEVEYVYENRDDDEEGDY